MRELAPVFVPGTSQDPPLESVRSLLDDKSFIAFNDLATNTIVIGAIADNGDRLTVSLLRDAKEPEVLAAVDALKSMDKEGPIN